MQECRPVGEIKARTGTTSFRAVYNRRKEGNLEEQGLITNARPGDAGAFEELVRRHQDVAFRTAFLRGRRFCRGH